MRLNTRPEHKRFNRHMLFLIDAFPFYKEIVNNSALVDEPDSTRSVLFSQETINGWFFKCLFLVLKMHLNCARQMMVPLVS